MAWSTVEERRAAYKKNIFSTDGTKPFMYDMYAFAGEQPIKPADGWGTALRKVFLKGLLNPFLSFHRLCYVHPERAVALVLALAVIAFFAWPVIAGFMGAIVASTVALGASAIISSVVGYATVGLLALIGVSAVGNVQAEITKAIKGPIGDQVNTVNSSPVASYKSDSDDEGANSDDEGADYGSDDGLVIRSESAASYESLDDSYHHPSVEEKGSRSRPVVMGRGSDTYVGLGSSTLGTRSRSSSTSSQVADDPVDEARSDRTNSV